MANSIKKLYASLLGKDRLSDYISPPVLSELSSDEEKTNQSEKKIEELTDKAKEFSSNKEFWAKLLTSIEQARLAVVEKRWIPVQNSLTEAVLLVNRAIGSEALRVVRIGLAVIPFLWFFLFYFIQRLLEQLGGPESVLNLLSQEYFQYVWLGLLGGTTMVVWGIVKHSMEMDFDPTHILWYLFLPALGAVTGVLVVLVVQAIFVLLHGELTISNTEPLLVFALIGGFSGRVIIRLIDRTVKAIFGGARSPEPQRMFERSQPLLPEEMSEKSEEEV